LDGLKKAPRDTYVVLEVGYWAVTENLDSGSAMSRILDGMNPHLVLLSIDPVIIDPYVLIGSGGIELRTTNPSADWLEI